jgi:hypothetical protein
VELQRGGSVGRGDRRGGSKAPQDRPQLRKTILRLSHYRIGAASKAVRRQQQLDRTQQTFDAAASVAQSIGLQRCNGYSVTALQWLQRHGPGFSVRPLRLPA